jgi:hypothetical protein
LETYKNVTVKTLKTLISDGGRCEKRKGSRIEAYKYFKGEGRFKWKRKCTKGPFIYGEFEKSKKDLVEDEAIRGE